ncbi:MULTISPECIES: TrlF family AAA-like ATPase [unclassified Chryseobacterium]|uniref:TrlF family AAA-like ATPase n=1 Tax=unclassified Chryseobacterium TaxID=2593645 RepID=UPI0030198885
MTINRGSEWRKWDLHIHTPASINQNYGNNNDGWEKFINALENLPSDVKVIGITDYYFIDGYEKVMEYKQNGRLTNIEKIFPILEFRIDTFGSASESKLQKINLHILFNLDEADLKKEINCVRKEFIEQIPITKLDRHSTKMLSIDNLTVEGNNDLSTGFANLIPPTDIVFNKIKSDTWKDKVILFLGYKEWSNLDKNQQLKPFKEDLYSKVDAFFSNGFETNEKNQNWLNEYGNKRLLHSLDIHDFNFLDTFEFDENNIKKPSVNYFCNTWIKAQPTFEGLKQIIYEPNERVKVQKDRPESDKLDNLMISKVTFTSSKDRFTPNSIYFNKNLNVIIGGKSSGKSILLYEIAKTLYKDILPNDEDEKKLKNDILKYKDSQDNIYKDLYDLSVISKDEIDENYNFEVELFSGSKQRIKDRVPYSSSILTSIKYIPQNHLSNLVDKSRKSGATLKKLIRDLILEKDIYRKKYDEFVEQAKKNDKQRRADIDFYFSLKENLHIKQQEILAKGDIKSLEEGINFNKKKIEELNKLLSPEELEKYKNLTDKMNDLKIKRNKIFSDQQKLNNYLDDLKRFLLENRNKKKIVLESLETEDIKNEYTSKLQFIDEAFDSVEQIINEISKDDKDDFIEGTLLYNKVKETKDELQTTKNDIKPYQDKLEDQKQLEILQKSISTDEIKLSEIKQFQKEIESINKNIIDQKEKIFIDFKNNFKLYEKIIEELKPRITLVQNKTEQLEIKPSIKYNFPEFRNITTNLFNQKGFNYSDFNYLYEATQGNLKTSLEDITYDDIEKSLRILFEKIENKKLTLKGGNKESDACDKIFTDLFFDHWDVESQGDDIHKMSTGKASFVLLKLIIKLSIENGPILIDQPEDNLDNRSVSRELVEYLKEKKKERQIILVTHNPNIVVNADAENIIVANQKSQLEDGESNFDFDYINGALEDSYDKREGTDILNSMGIRQHITEIVEGGKEAFKKREEKYGF